MVDVAAPGITQYFQATSNPLTAASTASTMICYDLIHQIVFQEFWPKIWQETVALASEESTSDTIG